MKVSLSARAALAVALAHPLAAAAAAQMTDAPVVDAATAQSGPGWIGVRTNADLLRMAGVSVKFTGAHREGAHEVYALDATKRLTFEVPVTDGTVFKRGELRSTGGMTLAGPGGRLSLRALSLVPHAADADRLDLVGADGTVWMYLDPMMFGFDADGARLLVPTADLHLADAAARRLGVPALAGDVIGEVRMVASVTQLRTARVLPKAEQGRNCVSSPIWPGTPGYVADVFLIDMPDQQFRRCRLPGSPGGSGNDCDGPGATDGEVVFTSAAHLKNRSDPATTADIPWHFKFQGNFPPYGNDQHPFLVGALYRIDALGRIEQIGRSQAKHAFFTTNLFGTCTTSCNPGYVLGPGCEDVYTLENNDQSDALGPRREVIASRGQWGRCGSIYDDVDNNPSPPVGCDGTQDSGGNGNFDNRMIVRETQIDPAQNAGARYLAEAWYVIRDDSNILNSMGHREFSPAWSGFWDVTGEGAFVQGAALDAWVDSANPGPNAASSTLALADGSIRIASRATALGGGRWRYDYAVMNFDFSRATTENAEPNLRVLTNRGLDGFAVPGEAFVGVGSIRFADGNLDGGDNWASSQAGGGISWSAGAAPTQAWGSMYAFGFEADMPPESGTVAVGADGAQLATAGAIVPRSALFRDSFEDP